MIENVQLTRNFNSAEFVVSDTHPELISDITLTDLDLYKLRLLCVTLLQPIREKFGPVRILSGKRSKALNTAIGGAENSDHLFEGMGCAADFYLPEKNYNLPSLSFWVEAHFCRNYGQKIYYKTQKGDPSFIHISLPTDKHYGSAFQMTKGGQEK